MNSIRAQNHTKSYQNKNPGEVTLPRDDPANVKETLTRMIAAESCLVAALALNTVELAQKTRLERLRAQLAVERTLFEAQFNDAVAVAWKHEEEE